MAKITRKKTESVAAPSVADTASSSANDLSSVADDVLAGLSAEVDSLTQMIDVESTPASSSAPAATSAKASSVATQVTEPAADDFDALAEQMLAEQNESQTGAVSVDISATQVAGQPSPIEIASSTDDDLNADELSAAINDLVQQTGEAVDSGEGASDVVDDVVADAFAEMEQSSGSTSPEDSAEAEAFEEKTDDGTPVAEVIDDTPSEADSSDVDVLDQLDTGMLNQSVAVDEPLDDTQAAIDQMLAGTAVPSSPAESASTEPADELSDLDDLSALVSQATEENSPEAASHVEETFTADDAMAESVLQAGDADSAPSAEADIATTEAEDQEIEQLLEEDLSRGAPASGASASEVSIPVAAMAVTAAVGATQAKVAEPESPAEHVAPQPTDHEFAPAPARRVSYADTLVVHHQRSGKTAERYRALRTSLLALHPENCFAMMITSAEANEGKSVTCVNLALTLAEISDRRTIIVDGCLRASSLGRMLGITGGSGLADVLADRVELDMAIQSTNYKNLFVLPAGSVRENQVPELIGRSRLRDTCDALRRQFDFVLFDVPPILSISDPGIFGQFIHEALLVVRMNKTPQRVIDQAISHLRAINVTVCGAVLTHYRPALPRYLARLLQG